jgi:Type I restriction-modification system methyltransferase subunit
MEVIISQATKRNWERLNVTEERNKLTKRANKTNSQKTILPIEYFSNTGNIPKIEQLLRLVASLDCNIFDVMFSIVFNRLTAKKLVNGCSATKSSVQHLLNEYNNLTLVPQILEYQLPDDEEDLLGLVYQSLYVEGDKNKQGLYYTPTRIVKKVIEDIEFCEDFVILDPCCGSGNYLLNVPHTDPSKLFGVDFDPIAVMLCKANLIMKYIDLDFVPQIYCFDFLAEYSLLDSPDTMRIRKMLFDCICTNPPWGAIPKTTSKTGNESFACFLSKSLEILKPKGVLNFLLPEAVLNVKTYSNLREQLLDNYSVDKIHVFPNLFTCVTTKFISLEVSNVTQSKSVLVYKDDIPTIIDKNVFRRSNNYVFSLIDSMDQDILDLLSAKGKSTLSESTWALGIVTGNNSEKLLDKPSKDNEPIYTGKEIRPYKLLMPKKYVIYDRSQFQQVAKDEIYRAEEKLVYKFISNKLVFSYDNSKSLFLNSANILIPIIPTMSMKSVLLFLNSELFQFAYMKRFGEIKILKGNLCELFFPIISKTEDSLIQKIVDRILYGDSSALEDSQGFVYDYYRVSQNKIDYIRRVINNGKLA